MPRNLLLLFKKGLQFLRLMLHSLEKKKKSISKCLFSYQSIKCLNTLKSREGKKRGKTGAGEGGRERKV